MRISAAAGGSAVIEHYRAELLAEGYGASSLTSSICSSASGRRCKAYIHSTSASASSATCPSTSRWTPLTCGRSPRCSGSTRTAVPTEVAGVPPDYFSAGGQLWGNPLYDYETMRDGRLRLVDTARRRGAASSTMSSAHRPFPRLCELLGRPLRRNDREKRPLASRAPAWRSSAC